MINKYTEFRIKFDYNKEYIPILKSDYVIKLNDHPKKGKLIDLYLPLPNPFYIEKYLIEPHKKENITFNYNTDKFFTRVFVARHWPKRTNEEHMLILLPYKIHPEEKYFKGERLSHPIGNWSILERGDMYLLSFYHYAYIFFYIVYLKRKIGILPFGRGSVYAIYLDFKQEFSTSNIKQWTKEPLFLRNQRIYTGQPNIKINKLIDLQPITRFH